MNHFMTVFAKSKGFPSSCNHQFSQFSFPERSPSLLIWCIWIAPVAPHNSHFPAFNRSIRLVRQAYIIRLGCLSISDCLVGTLRLNPSWYSVRSFSLPFLSLNLTVNSPFFCISLKSQVLVSGTCGQRFYTYCIRVCI